MKPASLFLALAFALICRLPTPAAEAQSQPQRVLFVGSKGSPRAEAFENFLKQHFAKVETANRLGFDPAQARDFDVVLLDWPQNGGKEPFPPTQSPFGVREQWGKPTVLLGSAGLHLAIVWKLKGGSG